MNEAKRNIKGAFAILALALMLVVAVVPATSSSDGADTVTTYTINVQKGQVWAWTPTFTSGLSPTITVSASSSAMPENDATFGATSGNAKVESGTVKVQIPSTYSGSNYFVKIKAQTTQPTQIKYYAITFNVEEYTLSYSSSTVIGNVGHAITSLTPTTAPAGKTVTSYAITNGASLPAGITLNTSTGVISGTPTAYCGMTTVEITATFNTTPAQTAKTTISIGAFLDIVTTNYTVYAIKGQTAISIPGTAMPDTHTTLDSMTLTATKDGSSASVTAGTAYNGMTVAANTGAISGTPSVAGTYVFTEKYTATAATGGSTSTRTVTVVVEDPVAISGNSSFNSFKTHSDSVTLTKSGPANVAWSITKITKAGTEISSGTDFSSFSVSNAGVLTSSADTTAGTYVVTVKAVSTNTTANTSGATGESPANNYKTKDVTVTVADKIAVNPSDIYFYLADSDVFDEVSVVAVNSTGNTAFSGATFSITSYGTGLDSTMISLDPNTGAITPGSVIPAAGDYTATVTVQDPNNPDNKATGTIHVHTVAVLEFTSEPSAGILTVW